MRFWRSLWYLLITASAIVAMGFAVAVTYTPELLPSNISRFLRTVTEQIDAQTTLIGLGLLVALGGIIGLWVWRVRDHGTELFDPDVEKSNRNVPVAGQDLKKGFEIRDEPNLNVPGHPTAGDDLRNEVTGKMGVDTSLSEESVKEALRDVLREAYRADFTGQSEVDAYITRGKWTNDRYAAAFMSSGQEIDYPLRHRIIAWLYPDRAKEIRVRRSLQAVESVANERFSLYENAVERHTGVFERLKDLLGRLKGRGEQE